MKVFSLDLLSKIAAELREAGKRIVLAHGVFDLPHVAHLEHLRAAKALGDALFVTVTADRFVNKGAGRPLFEARWRAVAMAAVGCVDYVAVNYAETAVNAIWEIKPNLYVKGGEYRNRVNWSDGLIAEVETVEAIGGSLAFTDGPEFHSTELIRLLKGT